MRRLANAPARVTASAGNGAPPAERDEAAKPRSPALPANVSKPGTPLRPATKLACFNKWIVRLQTGYAKLITDLLRQGQELIQAKKELEHGMWEEMFESGRLPFSLRTAQKLMQVAEKFSKAPNSALLPLSLDALCTLARLDGEVIQRGLSEGKITPDMTLEEVKRFVLDQKGDENPNPKGGRPFEFSTTLKSAQARLGLVLNKIPEEDRARFKKELIGWLREWKFARPEVKQIRMPLA